MALTTEPMSGGFRSRKERIFLKLLWLNWELQDPDFLLLHEVAKPKDPLIQVTVQKLAYSLATKLQDPWTVSTWVREGEELVEWYGKEVSSY